MSSADIYRKIRHAWRTHGTLNNIVVAIALAIAASWAWGTISTMQTNFAAERSYSEQQRQLKLAELQVETLQYEQNYYKSDEYKDLMARTNLGLASPGEKVLLLPPNSAAAKAEGVAAPVVTSQSPMAVSNLEQWVRFLTGTSAHDLQK